ncbi:MAG TPA: cytochrome C [Xanthobacteraceae bacterium]|nr:cytochrome C [Xanthobacteraceae bacterium]
MTKAACVLMVVLLCAGAARAAERPDWAFPATDKVQPPATDDGKPKTAPGSTLALTRAQIDDLYNPPDWYPDMHPPMPDVVAHGDKPEAVRACASCHLPTGTGHDESAYVAGLPAGYFIRQIADYKSGNRKGSGMMIAMAKTITEQEVKDAAGYFAALKPRPWIRVVETDTVPKTFVGKGNKRLAHPDGGTEPIGDRIIEIPEDENIVLNRDPRAGFVAYVPKGSIAKGEALVAGRDGKTIACAICHGPTLQGLGEVPAIAGRHPNYIVRQLWSIQNGERVGSSAALMTQVVDKLDVDDMLAIAAYVASRTP